MKFLDASRLGLAPAALCLFTAAPALAQIGGTLVSPPSLANQNGAGDIGHDFAPSLVSDGGNVWTCVFTTNEASLTNGGDMDIFWIRSRDLGATWSTPAPISASFLTDSGITSSDVEPALATDGFARMAVWASTKTSPTGNYGIYSAYSNSSGTIWVNPLPIGSAFALDAVDDRNPCIAAANGTFVTVWERVGMAGDHDLWFSRTIGSGGPQWSAPALIDPSSALHAGTDIHPRIATDGAGHWVVVFQSNEDHSIGTDFDIYAYRSADDGVTWLGPQLVNPTGSSDGNADDVEPSIAVDVASGTWMCAWRTFHTFGGTTGGDAEIVYSTSTTFGFLWSAVGHVNTDYATDQATSTGDSEPFISADQHGHFMVSWTRTLTNDSDTDLRAARSDDLGATWTTPQFIDIDATPDSGTDSGSQLVADSEGHWVAVWQSNDNVSPSYGFDLDVMASRFMIPRGDDDANFCFGYTEVGNGLRCPCGNDSPITSHSGCLNSSGNGGQVGMSGPFSASAPTQVITVGGVPPGAPVLFFQGTGIVGFGLGTPFGDGLLCASATIDRLGVIFTNVNGNGGLTFTPTGVSSGALRFYQGWYRDSASFCTSATFNLTSAFGTVWAP